MLVRVSCSCCEFTWAGQIPLQLPQLNTPATLRQMPVRPEAVCAGQDREAPAGGREVLTRATAYAQSDVGASAWRRRDQRCREVKVPLSQETMPRADDGQTSKIHQDLTSNLTATEPARAPQALHHARPTTCDAVPITPSHRNSMPTSPCPACSDIELQTRLLRDNRTAIWEVIAQGNSLAARCVREHILGAIRKLIWLPHKGIGVRSSRRVRVESKTVRECLMTYAPDAGPLVVLAVLHRRAVFGSSRPLSLKAHQVLERASDMETGVVTSSGCPRRRDRTFDQLFRAPRLRSF